MPKSSPAQLAAAQRYKEKHYKNFSISLRPEEIDAIKEAAAASGKSIARYVVDCCTKNTEKPLDKDCQE